MGWEFAWTDSVDGAKLGEIIAVKLLLQIFGVGVVAGFVLGRLIELAWRLTSDAKEQCLLTVAAAMLALFGFRELGMSGGGTLAVLTIGATLHSAIRNKDMLRHLDDTLAYTWRMVGSTILFTLLGASVNQSALDASLLGAAAG